MKAFARLLSTTGIKSPLLVLKNASLYPFTAANPSPFANLNWTIGDSEAWAVIGSTAAELVDAAFLGEAAIIRQKWQPTSSSRSKSS